MTERNGIEKRVEQLKKNLADYVRLSPLLKLPEEDIERVVNQFLDDINREMEKLKKME